MPSRQLFRVADRSQNGPNLQKRKPSAPVDYTSNTAGVHPAGTSGAPGKANIPNKQSCHLLRMPAEVRLLIYDLVLVSKDPISNVHKLLDSDDSIHATGYDARIGDIDSRLLQTCRAVYQEAAPVLYGTNTFCFSKQDHIEAFKGTRDICSQTILKASDSSVTSSGNRVFEKYGRLALLRKVILRLGSSDDLFISIYPQDPKNARDSIWRGWYKLFDRKQYYLLDFPMLERLTLDLSDWRLTADDVLRARIPFTC